MEILFNILFIVICLSLMFITISVESAFFALTKTDLEKLDKKNEFNRKIILYRHKPRYVVVTSLTSLTILSLILGLLTLGSAQQTSEFTKIGHGYSLLMWFSGVVLCALIVGGIFPRLFALTQPLRALNYFLPSFLIIHKILFPISWVLHFITDKLAKIANVQRENFYSSESQVSAIIESEEEQEEVTDSERKMIRGIIEFGDKTAREIMVPRPDVTALSVDMSIQEAIRLVKNSHRSRIPVYEESIDHIIGILYAKDLLGELPENATIRTISRSAHSVPEYKNIDELLADMQRLHIHMAIVIDEYGGTSGVVTLEDIVEEIIGEIQDEYDRESKKITKESDSSWIVDGSCLTFELNREIDSNVIPESEEYDTVGGYIFSLAGKLPEIGETYSSGNWRFSIIKRTQTRINLIRLEKEEID